MQKKIRSALISVFYKDGLEVIVRLLHESGVRIFSTGGTEAFIRSLGVPCTAVESVTGYPSILGGRVKTLHPLVFGGILGRSDNEKDQQEMKSFNIPGIDLVIVDLYPFEETVASTDNESLIIEKIDVGGPSMIRAAAKNFKDVVVIASKNEYPELEKILREQHGKTDIVQRREFASTAFHVCSGYDIAISNYFSGSQHVNPFASQQHVLRYGENPHQHGVFAGDLSAIFEQLNGKELSYNNLVDVDAAVQLIAEFSDTTFAIIKHTNVCGIAARTALREAWDAALAGDPESAFGGVLVCNTTVDVETAEAISEIFFEVLVAPAYDDDALAVLKSKKNRILLQMKGDKKALPVRQFRSLLHGVLTQDRDEGNIARWDDEGGRPATPAERSDLEFANLVCKHLKSNAIALVKNKQLIGKGCGQTSRIDALRHSIEKAKHFAFDLKGAVMASDAFFPFNDCVKMGHQFGIEAFIQPGGSIRDKDSIDYCKQHGLALVMTGLRHFRH